MHGLPPDIDLAFFLDQRLLQVCVGAHDLQLHFNGGASVSIEGVIGCLAASGTETQFEGATQAAPSVIELLDRTIVSADGARDGTLDLQFDDGRRLRIYDSNDHYESYVIKYRDQMIAV